MLRVLRLRVPRAVSRGDGVQHVYSNERDRDEGLDPSISCACLAEQFRFVYDEPL